MFSFLFAPPRPKQINPGAAVPIFLCSRSWFRKEFPELPDSTACCKWAGSALAGIYIIDTGSAVELVRQVTHELLKHAAPDHAVLRSFDSPAFPVFACGRNTSG